MITNDKPNFFKDYKSHAITYCMFLENQHGVFTEFKHTSKSSNELVFPYSSLTGCIKYSCHQIAMSRLKFEMENNKKLYI